MGTSPLSWVQLSCALCLCASAAAAAFEPATSAHSGQRALPRATATSRAPPLLPRALTRRTVALRMEVEVAPADRGLLDGYAASSHRWPSIWDGKPYATAVVPQTARRAALVTGASGLLLALTLPNAPEYWSSAAVLESELQYSHLDSAGPWLPPLLTMLGMGALTASNPNPNPHPNPNPSPSPNPHPNPNPR